MVIFKPEDAQKLIDAIKMEDITEPSKILKNFVKRYKNCFIKRTICA